MATPKSTSTSNQQHQTKFARGNNPNTSNSEKPLVDKTTPFTGSSSASLPAPTPKNLQRQVNIVPEVSKNEGENFSPEEINTLLRECAEDMDVLKAQHIYKIDYLLNKVHPYVDDLHNFSTDEISKNSSDKKIKKYLKENESYILELKELQQKIKTKIKKLTDIQISSHNSENTLQKSIPKDTINKVQIYMSFFEKTEKNIENICVFYNLEQEKLGKELIQTFKDKIQDTYIQARDKRVFTEIAILFIVILACIASAIIAIYVSPLLALTLALLPLVVVLSGLAIYFAPRISNDELKATLSFVKHLTENFLEGTDASDKQLLIDKLSKVTLDKHGYYEFIAVFREIFLSSCADFIDETNLSGGLKKETVLYIKHFFKETFKAIKFEDSEKDKKLQNTKKDYLLKMLKDENIVTDFLEGTILCNLHDKTTQQKSSSKSFHFSEKNKQVLINHVRAGVYFYFCGEFPGDPNIKEIRDSLRKNCTELSKIEESQQLEEQSLKQESQNSD
jgi:hypothetical protein